MVYSKNYSNLPQIFVFKLLKMTANKKKKRSKLEQKSAMKFLMAENYKSCEIDKKKCDVFSEACLSVKIIYKHGFATMSLSQKTNLSSENKQTLW